MKRRNPPMVHEYVDRHGKARFYLRRRGYPKVSLQGLPWSPEFMAAYEGALAGQLVKIELGASRTVAGTLSAVLVSYYQSSAFKDLAQSTQQTRRAILERFRNEHGDKYIAMLRREHLQAILNSKTPAASRNWKKALRGFLDHCLSLNMIKVDPLTGIKLVKMKRTGGFHTWTEEEIAQYERRHAPGTKARLALALLLQTGHARADVVRMGRQ